MTALSKNVQRLVAVLLLLLCASLFGFAIGWPAVRYVNHAYGEQRRLEERIALAQARAAELPRIEAVAAEQATNPAWGRVYRDGDLGAATAEIERDMRAVLGSKFSAVAIERLGPTSKGDLTELGVRLRTTVTAADLADVLQRVESAQKLLRTRTLKVTSPLSQRDDRNELLDATLEVVGYWVEPARPSR